jgi:putative methionine-R-sulfoxide reductase with GAF domain
VSLDQPADPLREIAALLLPQREAVIEAWVRVARTVSEAPESELRSFCSRAGTVLERLSEGRLGALLEAEADSAARSALDGRSLAPLVPVLACFSRACLPLLRPAARDGHAFTTWLLALEELASRRLGLLLQAQEEAAARRLAEAEDRAARATEKARDAAVASEALRRSEARSQHRAEQIGLLGAVFRRIAGVLDPDLLMQEAAEAIQARMNHTYVAVVVVDDEGVLIGRWAGRSGVGRRSSGRAQGPAGGIIGRALRKKSPQVVADVSQDPDYHADVPGTHSEMAIPLLERGEAIGALDFQTEKPGAFDLDDVAAGETLADYLVVALRNARLVAELRRRTE